MREQRREIKRERREKEKSISLLSFSTSHVNAMNNYTINMYKNTLLKNTRAIYKYACVHARVLMENKRSTLTRLNPQIRQIGNCLS